MLDIVDQLRARQPEFEQLIAILRSVVVMKCGTPELVKLSQDAHLAAALVQTQLNEMNSVLNSAKVIRAPDVLRLSTNLSNLGELFDAWTTEVMQACLKEILVRKEESRGGGGGATGGAGESDLLTPFF